MAIQNQKWITCPGCESPVIEKIFFAEESANAYIDICGLGCFELCINGIKVSADLLVPAWSQYQDRPNRRTLYAFTDTLSAYRTYYLHYDISEYLVSGQNRMEVLLGNGWYNQRERTVEGDFWYGDPKLCFEMNISFEDGRTEQIVSDDSLFWHRSNIKKSNIFYGEIFDNTIEQNSKNRVVYCSAPEGALTLQTCPPDRVIRIIQPECIANFGNKKVYDAHENITGWVCFENRSEHVIVRYAEEINDDKTLNHITSGYEEKQKQMQKSEYRCGNCKGLCEPKFTWFGFRYFEIEGEADNVYVKVIHSDVRKTADFSCSEPVMNWLFDAYERSHLGNMHCGVIMDCPHRERLGYTGDTQATADIGMLVFDSKTLYEKIIRDIADGQDIYTGHIQHTAPFYGGGGGPGGWGSAMVSIPYYYHKHFGDTCLLETYYPNMIKYIGYMESRCENGLVVSEEAGGWCLGEWNTPEKPPKIPEPFVNTYFLIKSLIRMEEIACCIGKDGSAWSSKAELYKAALKKAYYDADKNTFCGGVNGADAFAADIGLANPEMLSALNMRYADMQMDTGIFGTNLLIDILFKSGYAKTAVKLLTEKKPNSFWQHMSLGATTLWEAWKPWGGSHNHHMFGGVVGNLFYHVLGLSTDEIPVFEPKAVDVVKQAGGSINTRFGKRSLFYETSENDYVFKIYAEQNAKLYFKGNTYMIEGGKEQTVQIPRK